MTLCPSFGVGCSLSAEQSARLFSAVNLKHGDIGILERILTLVALFIHGDTCAVAQCLVVASVPKKMRTLTAFQVLSMISGKIQSDIIAADFCHKWLRIERHIFAFNAALTQSAVAFGTESNEHRTEEWVARGTVRACELHAVSHEEQRCRFLKDDILEEHVVSPVHQQGDAVVMFCKSGDKLIQQLSRVWRVEPHGTKPFLFQSVVMLGVTRRSDIIRSLVWQWCARVEVERT